LEEFAGEDTALCQGKRPEKASRNFSGPDDCHQGSSDHARDGLNAKEIA
jgi:hypothetical protein